MMGYVSRSVTMDDPVNWDRLCEAAEIDSFEPDDPHWLVDSVPGTHGLVSVEGFLRDSDDALAENDLHARIEDKRAKRLQTVESTGFYDTWAASPSAAVGIALTAQARRDGSRPSSPVRPLSPSYSRTQAALSPTPRTAPPASPPLRATTFSKSASVSPRSWSPVAALGSLALEAAPATQRYTNTTLTTPPRQQHTQLQPSSTPIRQVRAYPQDAEPLILSASQPGIMALSHSINKHEQASAATSTVQHLGYHSPVTRLSLQSQSESQPPHFEQAYAHAAIPGADMTQTPRQQQGPAALERRSHALRPQVEQSPASRLRAPTASARPVSAIDRDAARARVNVVLSAASASAPRAAGQLGLTQATILSAPTGHVSGMRPPSATLTHTQSLRANLTASALTTATAQSQSAAGQYSSRWQRLASNSSAPDVALRAPAAPVEWDDDTF